MPHRTSSSPKYIIWLANSNNFFWAFWQKKKKNSLDIFLLYMTRSNLIGIMVLRHLPHGIGTIVVVLRFELEGHFRTYPKKNRRSFSPNTLIHSIQKCWKFSLWQYVNVLCHASVLNCLHQNSKGPFQTNTKRDSNDKSCLIIFSTFHFIKISLWVDNTFMSSQPMRYSKFIFFFPT